ncbi:MAG: FHA domain-containing protein [Betaproteobacteria bacterium]|nr:MAG: FHA domain-containing protein [Betaproteobacteria bacterium]
MAKLFWLQPDNTIVEFALKAEQNIIGRGGRSDIRIKHPGISAEHAMILSRDGIATVEDLKSTNGTRVNGRRIEKHTLRHGDQIEVGRERLMYFAQLDTASRFSQPVPETPFAEPAALGELVRTRDSAVAASASVEAPSRAPSTPPAAPVWRAAAAVGSVPAVPPEAPLFVPPSAPAVRAPIASPALVASIAVLSGAGAGKRYELDKATTTLGREGKQVVEIERVNPHQWVLRAKSGATPPYINGDALAEPRILVAADIIELTGVRLRFDVAMPN